MNKKLLITLLVGVMSLVLINAALVSYLSNSVKADVEVLSPMVVGISEGEDHWATTECMRADTGEEILSFPECESEGIHSWSESDWTKTGTLTLDPMYTGQDKTFTLYTMSENIADAHILGFEEAIVTNWDGVTCADFESVKIRTDSIYGDLGYGTEHELIPGGCKEIDEYHVQFGGGNSDWNVGETDVAKMVVTFNDVIGTYTFSYRVIPAI